MPLDENGCTPPGKNGVGVHLGDPLTVAEIAGLPDGAEIVVTWDGGNGPHPYRVLVGFDGLRYVENLNMSSLLAFLPDQLVPLHRVTLGWDDETRAWHDARIPPPEHIQAQWRRLRGITEEENR